MNSNELTFKPGLIEIEKSHLLKIIRESGILNSIDGESGEEKIEKYAEMIQSLLNATFPTQSIVKMLEENQLNSEKFKVSEKTRTFLNQNKHFDLATSRIEDFIKETKEVAGEYYYEVIRELKVLQRVFQVSPRVENVEVLLENGLHSAYTIANIPRKSFIKMYSSALGGEHVALAIHLRASHIYAKAE